MLVTGLRGDADALEAGADWVAEQVVAGRRLLDREMIEDAVKSRALRAGPARAVVSVATLSPDPLAVHLDTSCLATIPAPAFDLTLPCTGTSEGELSNEGACRRSRPVRECKPYSAQPRWSVASWQLSELEVLSRGA